MQKPCITNIRMRRHVSHVSQKARPPASSFRRLSVVVFSSACGEAALGWLLIFKTASFSLQLSSARITDCTFKVNIQVFIRKTRPFVFVCSIGIHVSLLSRFISAVFHIRGLTDIYD